MSMGKVPCIANVQAIIINNTTTILTPLLRTSGDVGKLCIRMVHSY